MTVELQRGLVDKHGRLHPLRALEPGDRIAVKEWDIDRGCLVFTVAVPGVPESREVAEHQEESEAA